MKKKSILSIPAVRKIQSKVKKIIQNDKEIGKLSGLTPYIVSKATEFFIEELIKSCSTIANERGDSKATVWHLSQVLQNDQRFSFLQTKAMNNPQILSASEPKKPKKKPEPKDLS